MDIRFFHVTLALVLATTLGCSLGPTSNVAVYENVEFYANSNKVFNELSVIVPDSSLICL